MNKIAIFIIIVVIWVALWGIITIIVNELLTKWITKYDPIIVRFIAYILIAIIGFVILCLTNNVDYLV